MKIMPVKTVTIRVLYVHVVVNGVIFQQISSSYCSIRSTLSACQIFPQVLL